MGPQMDIRYQWHGFLMLAWTKMSHDQELSDIIGHVTAKRSVNDVNGELIKFATAIYIEMKSCVPRGT